MVQFPRVLHTARLHKRQVTTVDLRAYKNRFTYPEIATAVHLTTT